MLSSDKFKKYRKTENGNLNTGIGNEKKNSKKPNILWERLSLLTVYYNVLKHQMVHLTFKYLILPALNLKQAHASG